ncbi:MAG: Na/Pi symporter [Spirochaetaceae bacterium]|jgi:phosphate:Na+ symporter|nr:Na/Pi symporter [Spirochaetaceae bacterium]
MYVMNVLSVLIQIGGSLGLFLYGLKVLGDGIQQSAGDSLQKTLKLITGNRLSAVFTGFAVTAIIQSSSATTVMVVSFVNAGLFTLHQAIGVIMGANIGTTVTAWVVSLLGFNLEISNLAIPAIGLGFLLRHIKWKHRETGNVVIGFGLLFLGLDFLTNSMPDVTVADLAFMTNFHGKGAILLAAGVSVVITLIIHSSSAATAIFLTMAFNNMINYEQAAAMILGANIGTTIDAVLAAAGASAMAKRSALIHVLFNVIGAVWALLLFNPLLHLVAFITPNSSLENGLLKGDVTTFLAMFHTAFNVINTLIFLPFVNPLAKLVGFLIKEKENEQNEEKNIYHFQKQGAAIRETPELDLLRVEKEMRDMAGIVFSMYGEIRASLSIKDAASADDLERRMSKKTDYLAQMREELGNFLMWISRSHVNGRTLHNISFLLRIISDLKDMGADCYSMACILQTSVRKKRIFEELEVNALHPYTGQVEKFLAFVQENICERLTQEQINYAAQLESEIDVSRNALRKLGRKRIEDGCNVKTELLFIDLVRRIEKLGDYCFTISKSLSRITAANVNSIQSSSGKQENES